MLSEKNIVLRAVEPEDLEFLYKIENDPSVWVVSARREPYSRFNIKQYIQHGDKSVFERGQLRFIISENSDNSAIGAIDIFNFDFSNKKAEFGIYILPQYQRLGYAYIAIELLCQYCKKYLNLHQIYAYAESGNDKSKNMLLKSGFLYIATLKEWVLFNSQFYDIDIFQKILDYKQ